MNKNLFKKEYLCFVEGFLDEKSGKIDLPNCQLTKKSDNTYAFSKTVEDMTLKATMGVDLEMDITANSITVSGSFSTGGIATDLSIDLNINATVPVLGDQIIVGAYEGTRDAAE